MPGKDRWPWHPQRPHSYFFERKVPMKQNNDNRLSILESSGTIVSNNCTISTYRMVFFPRFLHIFWLRSARRFRNNSAASVVMMAASFCTIGMSGSSFIAYSTKEVFVHKSNHTKTKLKQQLHALMSTKVLK